MNLQRHQIIFIIGLSCLIVAIVFSAVIVARYRLEILPPPDLSTSRQTNILVDGDILKEIAAQNITSVSGVATIQVDTIDDPATMDGVIITTPSSVTDIVAASGVTVSAYVMQIQSSTAGNCDISASPQIADGQADGQHVFFMGSDDTKTVQFDDGTGLVLSASCTLGDRDVLHLIYMATDDVWVQSGPCQDN